MGVDNVIVELDNLELPILDGSALPYVEAFERVGIRDAAAAARILRVLQPVEVREGDKFIGVYPGSGYRIDYTHRFSGADRPAEDLRRPGGGDLRRAELRRRGPLATRPTRRSCAIWD